jgi:hypothetical protein
VRATRASRALGCMRILKDEPIGEIPPTTHLNQDSVVFLLSADGKMQ